ncbi:hypothetical protein CsSME_00046710 [Camellia sinensis var. sinensis]
MADKVSVVAWQRRWLRVGGGKERGEPSMTIGSGGSSIVAFSMMGF